MGFDVSIEDKKFLFTLNFNNYLFCLFIFHISKFGKFWDVTPDLIGACLLLLHRCLTMIIPMMTHQHGVIIRTIEPHLGEKPKLGGRYTDVTLIYISCSVGSLYIHWFCFLFVFCCFFLKTQKYQKYFRCFSWFVSLFLCFGLP